MTRDEFLCEKMGLSYWDTHNHKIRIKRKDGGLDYYSPWEWFGVVWTWALLQEWWELFIGFCNEVKTPEWHIDYEFIHHDRFADALASYLGYKWT